ncbi:MAG: cytochrome c [Deltaproteobacteria bacterium]|nr:cytochrome c [Deltaproteobacteria bacterium]
MKKPAYSILILFYLLLSLAGCRNPEEQQKKIKKIQEKTQQIQTEDTSETKEHDEVQIQKSEDRSAVIYESSNISEVNEQKTALNPESATIKKILPHSVIIRRSLIFSAISLEAGEWDRLEPNEGSRIFLNSNRDLNLTDHLGHIFTFRKDDGHFGSLYTHPEGSEYDRFYNFSTDGWIAFQGPDFSFMNPKTSALSRYRLPESLVNAEIISPSPGFVFLKSSEKQEPYSLSYGKNEPEILAMLPAEQSLLHLAPCESGCAYWAFDGKQFFYSTAENARWKAFDIAVVLPEDFSLQSMAGAVSMKETGQMDSSLIYALDKKRQLWELKTEEYEEAVTQKEITWDHVLAIARESCIPCHSSDGFDRPGTWTGLKSTILNRIDPSNKEEVFAMPTWDSVYGRNFSDNNRQDIITWLSEQESTEVKISSEAQTTDKDISDSLRPLAESYCLNCHQDGRKESWWKKSRDDIIRRIQSGNMPKGLKIPEDKKAELLNAIP